VAEPFVLTHLWKPPVPFGTKPGFYLAIGPQDLPSWALQTLAPALHQGSRVFWVDACNQFNLYGLTRAAQALGLDVRRVLSAVQLARPFTAFQLERLVASELIHVPAHQPVILSDPLSLFYDSDLHQDDAYKLFGSFLGNLKKMSTMVLLLAVERQPPENRKIFSQSLLRQAMAIARLSVDKTPPQLETLRQEIIP